MVHREAYSGPLAQCLNDPIVVGLVLTLGLCNSIEAIMSEVHVVLA